jgi:TRAP-type C4-dicarboxylate transport system substrate-binding protein
MNEKFYQSLSPSQKKAVEEALEIGIRKSDELLEVNESKMVEALRSKGMTVIQPDIAAFRKATAGVAKTVKVDEAWGPGVYDKIKSFK